MTRSKDSGGFPTASQEAAVLELGKYAAVPGPIVPIPTAVLREVEELVRWYSIYIQICEEFVRQTEAESRALRQLARDNGIPIELPRSSGK